MNEIKSNDKNVDTSKSKETRHDTQCLVIDSKLYLGTHVSLLNSESLHHLMTDILLIACNVFQIFLGSPRSLPSVRCLSDRDIEECRQHVEEYNKRFFIHHPYVSNFARRDISKSLCRLRREIDHVRRIDNKGAVVIHPGSSCCIVDEVDSIGSSNLATDKRSKKRRDATENERNLALDNIVKSLSKLNETDTNMLHYVAIENAAGERGKLCSSLEEMKYLAVRLPDIRFCIDTAHAFGAGLCKFQTRDQVSKFFRELDEYIGLDRIACIHLNDSLVTFNGHADRHQRVGYGYIWSDDMSGLCELLRECGDRGIPMIGEGSLDAYGDVVLLRELYSIDIVNVTRQK